LTSFVSGTPLLVVNPNPHQKNVFCARQQLAAGGASFICPERPGAAS
jgi:hypothetical protein